MSWFDKYQKTIAIIGIASFALSLIFWVWNSATAIPLYSEEDVFIGYDYEAIPQALYSIALFLNIASIAWFLARLITYKMRLKEVKEEEQGY